MSIEKLDYSYIRHAQKPYTTYLNEVIQNIPNAFYLGVYCYLSSLPHDWIVNRSHLMNHFKVGRDKIKDTMSWLSDNFLIEYSQDRNENGTLGKSIIIVKDGLLYIENIIKKQTVNKELLDSTTGGLKNRRTEKPLNGKTAPTNINKKTNKTKDIKAATKLPVWLNEKIWEEFKEHRKEMRKPLTELAEKKALLVLDRLKEKGNDPVEVITTSIVNGWSGLFETKKNNFQKLNKPNEVRSTVQWFSKNH